MPEIAKPSEKEDLETLVSGAGALIFDCDGTLVDTPELYAMAWQHAFRSAGYVMTRDWYLKRAGLSEQVLLDAFETEHDVRLDRNRAVSDMRSSLHRNIGKVPEITSVCDIARRQRGQKPMAVASGGPRSAVVASLQATRLLPVFDTVITIEDVALPKPAPDLFLEAARKLGVEPSACLVFEDSPQGIEAAGNAGMQVIDVHGIIAA
ncbi:MAG: HAD family phosphatase [Roseibium sp.]|uniref:HAD family hydrolase n=1 Tax=Roseibium sp. TaxID=1936156 RepID=UPI0026081B08|nr:HAD family phosphatase [Roseibium sp.]MCV0424791.1 HAD family phosphatase [Roseibium sp.]